MKPFEEIRERAAARKGGEAVLQSMLGPVPDNAAVSAVPDAKVLSTIAARVFSAGFVWRVFQ